MGGKHLKKLRAERSKVHFKKKALPKGQNITQTAFTVKKIVTVEQLKKVDENEPVSNWNIPLKDLLIRLNHYNFTSRLNGLVGIKELLTKYPEILKGPCLKSIIERLLELITDIEHKIRVTAINLLTTIFDLIPPTSIIPFHGILIVHLGCAMTHRTASIQLDSLKLIDVLIKYSPEAVECNFKSIAQNFIRILKNYLQECHSGLFLPKGSQENLENVKAEMLLKFYQFLVAGFNLNKAKEEFSNSRCYNINILAKEIVSLRGTNDQYKQTSDLSLLSKFLENREITLTENKSNEFQSLCLLVIPLLFDTWIEFSPSQSGSECVLSEGIGKLLLVILQILLLFYEKATTLKDANLEHWFVSNYGPVFKKSFMPNFPYMSATIKGLEASHCTSSEGNRNSFHSQNLIICFLSYSFKIVNKSSQVETKMENYLSNALLIRKQTDIEILLKIIEIVINASKYKKSKIFVNNVMKAYNSINNPELRIGLSKVLMQVVLEENDITYAKDHIIIHWVKSLTDHLHRSQIFIQDIQTILKLINHPVGNEILKKLECEGEQIMMNLPNIRIEGAPQLEGQKLIVNILYKCDCKILEELLKKKKLMNLLYPPELKNYILDIFSYKLKNRLGYDYCSS